MHTHLTTTIENQLAEIDLSSAKRSFEAANEFIQIPGFLSRETVSTLVSTLPNLAASVHRNFIPLYKKGGSVSRYDLDTHAPIFSELYHSASFSRFLNALCGRELIHCPDNDPHSYALYYYTEPGDHIGYHYDTSYYRGARYTVLLGLIDDSSCRLECQLFRDDDTKDAETIEVRLEPGTFVFFNGDKLYHRITPLGENEQRIALTLEYLTTEKMNPMLRFVSNMKDSIAYFGFKQVFGRHEK